MVHIHKAPSHHTGALKTHVMTNEKSVSYGTFQGVGFVGVEFVFHPREVGKPGEIFHLHLAISRHTGALQWR
jgi:hypothetical protein